MRWWLSFVDPDRPEGERNLGACIVHGLNLHEAIEVSWQRGINPGGEVRFMRIDESVAHRLSFELPEWKLLTTAEAKVLADRVAAEIGA